MVTCPEGDVITIVPVSPGEGVGDGDGDWDEWEEEDLLSRLNRGDEDRRGGSEAGIGASGIGTAAAVDVRVGVDSIVEVMSVLYVHDVFRLIIVTSTTTTTMIMIGFL